MMIGQSIAHYKITEKIGAGGMGEVYRARDARLNREVALKVLPPAVAKDSQRMARFAREAQVLAQLNHPNIAAIYGLEEWEGQHALVLELVEGETLAERIRKGAIPLEESLGLALQMAEALEAAHEKGVIHRDLKPANVKITPEGTVKVLDFGLAKAMEGNGVPSHDLSQSPTLSMAATRAGLILGTAAYMAPEQARGVQVDKRADIWAFGVVLFEMLSGEATFRGDTVSDVLASVLKNDLDWSALPADLPPAVLKLLKRSLVPDCRQRLRDIGESRILIEEYLEDPAEKATTLPLAPNRAGGAWPTWVAAVLALALVTLLVWNWRTWEPPAHSIIRYDVHPPNSTALNLVGRPSIALSPDGEMLAFTGRGPEGTRLYIRRRNGIEARVWDGTEGASNPVFSSDGKWIAFFAGSTLKKVALDGTVISLAPVKEPRGLSWADSEAIVYAPDVALGLFQVPADGGAARPVSRVEASNGERSHRWPHVLPGGKVALFTVGTLASPDHYDTSNIDAVVLATGERRTVLKGASMAGYVSTGHLIFAREGTLYAVGFDPDRLATEGAPFPVVRGVAGDSTTGAAHFTCAADGTLAYVPGKGQGAVTRLVRVDRRGQVQDLGLPPGVYFDPRISPDGTRLAVMAITLGHRDIWVFNFARKTFTRLTFSGINVTPVWSVDSRDLFYSSIDDQSLKVTVFRKPADGSRQPEAVASLEAKGYLEQMGADGASLLVDYYRPAGKADIIRVHLSGKTKPTPLVSTGFEELGASVAPGGRWLAHQSDESGRSEIYVRDLSASGGRWQISTSGGEEPHWSADGRELFYRHDSRLMVVAVETHSVFKAGTPKLLFDGIYNLRSDTGISYDVDRKGQGFVMVRLEGESGPPAEIRLVVNWVDELRRLAGVH